MNINIQLNKNFVTQFNKMCEKYGEDFLRLQGLNDDQLNNTDFIENFIDAENVAAQSIDANSNIAQKDIVTLLSEMSKPQQKLLAFNKIYYECQKKYGFKFANQAMESLWNYDIYLHDFNSSTWYDYCFAADLKPVVEKGLFFVQNYHAEPPQHLDSFVQIVMEWISYMSRRQSGAVGMPNLLPYLWYFWNKDCKTDYYTQSPERYRDQQFQALIYRLNQNWIRGDQSAFTNVTIFDHPYFEAIFGGSQFPDGTNMIDYEEEIIDFQKSFINVVNKIREKDVFTFPVLTASLLYKDEKFVDEEFAKWACEASRKWNLFNFFTDSTVNSLSNCCFRGDQKVLTRSSKGIKLSPIEEVVNGKYNDYRTNLTVFQAGRWVKAKPVKTTAKKLYEITTVNKKKIIVTGDHICPSYRGDIEAKELNTNDYLMFNTSILNEITEQNQNLTYELGYLVGMYAGDGSFEHDKKSYQIIWSLNHSNEKDVDILNRAIQQLDCEKELRISFSDNNVMFAKISDKKVYDFIFSWINKGYAQDKCFNLECLVQSKKFREGIIDGWYATDGGNSNRIYSVSKDLIETGEAILTSIGRQSIIDVSDRTGPGQVIIRGRSYNRNYPLYCIRFYYTKNKSHMKDIYIKKNNDIFFKIQEIKKIENDDEYVYCFEMKNQDEPYFTLPNGIITHNCRLKSNIQDLYFNSIGGTALEVGSVKVATLNLARLAYKYDNEKDYLIALKELVEKDLKILDVVRSIIKRNIEKGLLQTYSYGLKSLNSQYNTVGINGIFCTMKKFGYTETDSLGNTFYKPEAYAFGEKIFKTITNTGDMFCLDKDYRWNKEQAPAEQAAVKMQAADTLLFDDNVVTDLPLYGNQWIPLGIKTTLAERTKICSTFDKYCNGGSIEHINVDAPFDSFEKAWKMLNWVAKQGVTYFAFNGKVSQCNNYHSFYGEQCPICGAPAIRTYTRTVGFFTATETWSPERKKEFQLREWMPLNEQEEQA